MKRVVEGGAALALALVAHGVALRALDWSPAAVPPLPAPARDVILATEDLAALAEEWQEAPRAVAPVDPVPAPPQPSAPRIERSLDVPPPAPEMRRALGVPTAPILPNVPDIDRRSDTPPAASPRRPAIPAPPQVPRLPTMPEVDTASDAPPVAEPVMATAPEVVPAPRQKPRVRAVEVVQPEPLQAAPVQAAPVQTAPVQTAPVQTAPIVETVETGEAVETVPLPEPALGEIVTVEEFFAETAPVQPLVEVVPIQPPIEAAAPVPNPNAGLVIQEFYAAPVVAPPPAAQDRIATPLPTPSISGNRGGVSPPSILPPQLQGTAPIGAAPRNAVAALPRVDAGKAVPPARAEPLPPQNVAPAIATGAERAGYGRQLTALIESRKIYPRQAQRRRQEGTVRVTFTLDRTGQVISARIDRASGQGVLDEAALTLIRKRIGRFPTPPASLGPNLTFTVPIAYILR